MTDYKEVVKKVKEAVDQLEGEDNLKDIAFKTLLDHALRGNEELPTVQPIHAGTDEVVKSAVSKSRAKKSSQPTVPYSDSAIRKEVKEKFEDIDPNISDLKPLKSLKQKWEKYLWVLEVARRKGLDMLTNSEVAYILDEKLSLGVTEKQVNNLTFKVEAGYVAKRSVDGHRSWKILQPGIDWVTTIGNANE
jgi:hypothetical protein